MLPLQMYPQAQMLPPPLPPDLKPTATSGARDASSQPDGAHDRRAVVSPYQQAFPIRNSQAHQRAMSTSDSLMFLGHDYQLRRKTPNGTIDAGYDGSPTQLCPGPPPLKQMVLPTPALTNSCPYSSHGERFVTENPRPSPRYESGDHVDVGASSKCPRGNGSDGPDGPLNQSVPFAHQLNLLWRPGAHSMQSQPSTFYQPLMRACEYNVRAFCPPPPPMTNASMFGQFGWQPEPTTSGHQRSYEHFASIAPSGRPNRIGNLPPSYESRVHVQQPYFGGDGGAAANSHLAQDPTQPTSLNIQGLRLDSGSSEGRHDCRNQYMAQHTFKKKALLYAHRHYIDLLSCLQSVRKAGQGSGTSGFVAPPKPLVYPKIPKLEFDGPNLVRDRRTRHKRPDGPSTVSPMDDHVRSAMSNGHDVPRDRAYMMGQSVRAGIDASAASAPYAASFPLRAYPSPRHNDSINGPSSGGKPAPVANARNSLEVLRSLCEQSRWEWIDGLLLGGCLQYGLGHYQVALKWFSRVVALDSSHVEAITNMAATLYCLGRPDEAEQHWLMAVRLCPSHLDAAEHLVGLLYRKRNQDAIQVVCYIQQALRLGQGTTSRHAPQAPAAGGSTLRNGECPGDYVEFPPLQTDSEGPESTYSAPFGSSAPDYGSSGYAVPGSDNGRMLALVHAKGTMLYSLKDIQRASEAFEEAVLISVGRDIKSVQELVQRIHLVLSLEACLEDPKCQASTAPLRPLLLLPEKARKTAHLIFSRNGELPGLSHVPDGPAKRMAVQTTSNALLSLAKIYQDAVSNGNTDSGLKKQPSGVGDILALYYLSLSLQESPSTANNVGILLAGVQQSVAGTACVSTTLPAQPTLPGIVSGSGFSLALAYYNYGLRLDPKHVHLHTNLGSLLKDVGHLDLAIQMYERAVLCDGTFDIALTNLANAVKDKGRIKDAISYYRRAVDANPAFSEAVCGLFTALNSVCDWRGRGGVFLDFGRYDRWHVDENGALRDARTTMCGSGLTKQVVGIVGQQLRDASHWGCSIVRPSTIRDLLSQLQRFCSIDALDAEKLLEEWAGKAWEGARLVRLQERAMKVMQRSWYRDQYLRSKEIVPAHYPRPRLPPSLTIPTAPTVLPFHTFTCPLSAKDIRKISQSNAVRISCSTLRSSWLSSTIYPPPPPPSPHLNIGYISSDFNNHPLAHLMQSVFGFHDPQRVRAVCYATTPSDRSCHRQQIEREAPVFHDVSTWPPNRLIEQILADQIHVLVNLNGYTRGARNEIFAARPAPIQMSFMGFAGTLGAEWCDYILADETAIPSSTLRPSRNNVSIDDVFQDKNESEEPDWMYSENIIFCRDTFFCCDHAQSSGKDEREVTWEEEQRRRWIMRKELFPSLSDDAIILANFNQLYKIEPTTFRSWLRILARTPKAVLWLLKFPDLGESNLRHTAELWAGAEVASRVLFTDVAQKSQHISRARVCDLFLDTPECNAHTTAADVLWSSTPLLTLPRYPYKMCSRMAASILKGALPKSEEGQRAADELIARDEAEYEASAAELANGLSYSTKTGYGVGRGRLAEMRELLWQNRWKCALFNTRRWVNDVEEAYEEAWRRWVAGEGGDIYL